MFASLIAKIVARPLVAAWLIRRAQRTPYTHITSRDGTDMYMGRWWLFNPYGKGEDGRTLPARFSWLPSIRIHHILRADDDPHLHDHPWNARTFILRGWYIEVRPFPAYHEDPENYPRTCLRWRQPGDTAALKFGEYHRIVEVPVEGVWTLFVTWKYRGVWGFLVDGVKVPFREYLASRGNSK